MDSTDYIKAPSQCLLPPGSCLIHNTTVILGVLGIAQTRIETIEEIESRLRGALLHIDKDRLIVAHDCGLGMLSHETVLVKLSHLTQAVEMIG